MAQPFDCAQMTLTYGGPKRCEGERAIGVKERDGLSQCESLLVAPVGRRRPVTDAPGRIDGMDGAGGVRARHCVKDLLEDAPTGAGEGR